VEVNILQVIAVLIGLVLLWLVVKNSAQRDPQGGYQNGHVANPYPAPMNHGYPYATGNQTTSQASGCMLALAAIGFLAICVACLVLWMALSGNLHL
jgi:hypothetical protein